MSIRQIITIPDPVLRQISKPVERIDDELQNLLDDMLETMYEAPGIGLAAIQIGIPLRIVTIDIAKRRIVNMDSTERTGESENEVAPVENHIDENEDKSGDESGGEGGGENDNIIIEPDPVFLINPQIVSISDERSIYEEGCLSIPEFYAEVERPSLCKVQYMDRDGKQQLMDAHDILATCVQHEIDHLEGTLFIDHISKLKRDMVVKKFTKIAKKSDQKSSKNSKHIAVKI